MDEEQKDTTVNNDQPTPEGAPETASAAPAPDLQAKCDEYLAGWKRALADYENIQKQMSERRVEDRRRAQLSLAEELLPVVDNFGYVLQHVPDVSGLTDDAKKKFDVWFQGIGHIDRQFAEALKVLGVEPIVAVGAKFDPMLHESASSRKEDGKEPGVVLEEIVRGWKLGDLVIRPSKVVVSE